VAIQRQELSTLSSYAHTMAFLIRVRSSDGPTELLLLNLVNYTSIYPRVHNYGGSKKI
jgi:hypothetical protein